MTKHIPFSEFKREILFLYLEPMRKAATLAVMTQALRELESLEGVTSTSDISPGLVARWMHRYPRSSETTLKLLRCMKVAFNVAAKLKWIDVSPFEVRPLKSWIRKDARPSRNTGRVYRRDPEGIRHLVDMLRDDRERSWHHHRLYALFATLLYTAFRFGEAVHVLERGLDFGRQTITIQPCAPRWTPKTLQSARTAPMCDALTQILSDWVPHSHSAMTADFCGWDFVFPGARHKWAWSGGSQGYDAYSQIIEAAQRAGLGHVTAIYCRKWFGTQAKAMGLGRLEVESFLGHTCPYTQIAYDEEKVESMRPAVHRVGEFYAPTLRIIGVQA
jgi:integrase